MRIRIIPATMIAALLLGLAAFAQSTGHQSAAQNPGPSSPQQSPATSQGAQPGLMARHKVQEWLQQAGFKHIKILDESFLVQAKSPNGTKVMMVVNPPPQNQSAAGQSSRDNGGPASMTNSGPGVTGSKSGQNTSPSGSAISAKTTGQSNLVNSPSPKPASSAMMAAQTNSEKSSSSNSVNRVEMSGGPHGD
jgi:hypothetical protein